MKLQTNHRTFKLLNKQNTHPKNKPITKRYNPIEQDAIGRLHEISEFDTNIQYFQNSKGFSAWDKQIQFSKRQPFSEEFETKNALKNMMKTKIRRFSFWNKSSCNNKVRESKDFLRQSSHSSVGRRTKIQTEENSQNICSSEIFVRKFSQNDNKGYKQLTKRYLLNDELNDELIGYFKPRPFDSHCKTMLLQNGRPRTGNKSVILSRASHVISRNQSFERRSKPKSKFDILVQQSEKIIKKVNRKYSSTQTDNSICSKNNHFARLIKQRYKPLQKH